MGKNLAVGGGANEVGRAVCKVERAIDQCLVVQKEPRQPDCATELALDIPIYPPDLSVPSSQRPKTLEILHIRSVPRSVPKAPRSVPKRSLPREIRPNPAIKTKTGLISQGVTEEPGEFSNLVQQ